MQKTDDYKPPQSMREYIRQMKVMAGTVVWAFRLADGVEVRRWFIERYVFAAILVVMGVTQPRIVSYIFEGAVARNLHLVTVAALALGASIVVQKILDYGVWRSHEHLFGRALGNITVRLTELFFEKSPGQHREHRSLNHESMVKGKQRAFSLYIDLVPEFFEVAMTIAVAYVCLWFISPLAGICMTVVAFVYLGWSLYLNYRVAVVCTDIEREFSAFERYLVARWKFVERVIVSSKRRDELREIRTRWDQVAIKDRDFWLWHARQASYRNTASVLVHIAIAFYGGWLVTSGRWESVGLLYPLFTWSSRIMENIWRIGHVERRMSECVPSVSVMRETLAVTPDVADKPGAVALPADIPVALVFDRVGYHYPSGDADTPTISNVTFEVAPGQKLALVGPSGSGKSTLLSLVMRFMNPITGRILLAGVPLDHWTLESWMRAIAYIPQRAQTFDGTVRDNLLYALSETERAEWTDERLRDLMTRLAIDFGRRPVGENPLDIVVGRDGVQLSGGQAQRLAIGAAVVRRPRFMFVDEATSHLDSTTEKAVLEGLEELVSGIGMIVIAHRLSTVRAADKIVVLRDGEVEAEARSFRELYESSSTFRKLATDQDLVM